MAAVRKLSSTFECGARNRETPSQRDQPIKKYLSIELEKLKRNRQTECYGGVDEEHGIERIYLYTHNFECMINRIDLLRSEIRNLLASYGSIQEQSVTESAALSSIYALSRPALSRKTQNTPRLV